MSSFSNFMGTEFQYLNWGHFIISKLRFLIDLVLIIGVYKLNSGLIAPFALIVIFSVRMLGYIIIKTNIRESFIEKQNKAVINSLKEEIILLKNEIRKNN